MNAFTRTQVFSKTLTDGRTATVDIVTQNRGPRMRPMVYAIAFVDGKKLDDMNVTPIWRRPAGLPPEYTAKIGALMLTTAEAAFIQDKVQAAWSTPTLFEQRTSLVERVSDAGDDWTDAKNTCMEGGGDWDAANAAGEVYTEALATLDAFNAEHPEIIAELEAERSERVRRLIESD